MPPKAVACDEREDPREADLQLADDALRRVIQPDKVVFSTILYYSKI
jgi:hypothetical protein